MAVVAGGASDLALRVGVSMTLLQLGIGTVNDVVDAPYDAGRKAGKPIPAGLVSPDAARALAIACAGGGVALAATVSLALALLAGVVLAIGLAYDLRLKGTAWSWLPFAVGIPILPVYGWVGVTGTLHPLFVALVPAAVLAGAALAIANSVVDVERDVAAGRSSIAVALGRGRAGRLAIALLVLVGIVDAVAVASTGVLAPLGVGSVVAVLVAIGAAVWTLSRPDDAEWSWRAQAVSLGVAGLGYVAAMIR